MNASSACCRFALLCLGGLVLWWHTIVATVLSALHNDAYTHLLLILPISVGLVLVEWRSGKPRPEPNIPIGLALFVLAVLIGFIEGVWGRGSLAADVRLSLGMLAAVIWWIGAFVCCFGTRAFRICAFPLLFLFWLVPLPHFALGPIVRSLQQSSASAAQLLFQIAGVPVTQDGVVLSIPGLTLEVAKECSSIRSSSMLLVTGMVLAHLLLRSAWGKTVATLALLVLSVGKNGLRIFTLSMLSVYVDPSYLHGRLHHNGGVLFLLFSLACFFVLLWLIEWVERKTTFQQAVSNVARAVRAPEAES